MGVRIARQDGKRELAQRAEEVQRLLRVVQFSRMQGRAGDQVRVGGVDVGGRGVGVAGQPQVHVVGVGVEILRGVGQPPESSPRGGDIPAVQRLKGQLAMLGQEGVPGLEGVVVEVILVVAELAAQVIQTDIGGNECVDGGGAEDCAERLTDDLSVHLGKHTKIIRDNTVLTTYAGIICRMSFYTTKGDDGTTGLIGEGRVPKYHNRLEALGALDEASASLGLARAQTSVPQTAPILLDAQRDLYKLMAEVAATPENAQRFRAIDAARVTWLEEQTDAISQVIEMPREFILPGDTPGGAALSMARAIIRRAERRVVALFYTGEVTNPDLQRYLNRLSSLCFVLELRENQSAGKSTSLAKETP